MEDLKQSLQDYRLGIFYQPLRSPVKAFFVALRRHTVPKRVSFTIVKTLIF